MKICSEEEEQGLRYKDLNIGDVFTWIDTSVLPGDVAMKEKSGHLWIGKWEPGHPCAECQGDRKVLRYPNACITLGDPE